MGRIARDYTGFRFSTPPPLKAVGVETLCVGCTAVGFEEVPAGADSALITAEGADVRLWIGADPSTEEGILLEAPSAPLMIANIGRDGLHAMRFICVEGDCTAKIQAQFFQILSS